MASPSWWPASSNGEVALLDLRNGTCRLSFLNTTDGRVETFSEPAVLRQGMSGEYTHWGRKALAWKGRDLGTPGQVSEVFCDSWPVGSAPARWFMRRFAETYLPKRGVCKVHLLEDGHGGSERRWARELWQETLEDSAFSLQGYLTPWQHDLLLAKGGDPALALSPYLHFGVDEAVCSWRFIQAGAVTGEGTDIGLSAARLLRQLGDFLRRHLATEIGSVALRRLLLASCLEGEAALRLPVAGRQVHSGLPTRQTFAWADFLASRPTVVESWQEVKQRIFAQAKELCGVVAGSGEGLDLPGWRVLSAGSLAQLFIEGPVSRLMEARA